MNISLWKSQITQVPNEGLHSLAKDAEYRIGSHVAGGFPNQDYVEKQQTLLSLIQEELLRRRKVGE